MALKIHKIFFICLYKLQFLNNITHIKFNFSNLNKENNNINVLYFTNIFKHIKFFEIENIKNSYCFLNKVITFKSNSINNIKRLNLTDVNIKMKNEEILDYNIYNSISFPELTNLKYLLLQKVNLSILCLNEIISKNSNLIRIVILNCCNNNTSLYDEKKYAKLLKKKLKNCNELNYVGFNNNNFSTYLTNQIVYILIEIFFRSNKIYLIDCEYPNNNEGNEDKNSIFEFPKKFKECTNIISKIDFNRHLNIKFNPSLSYYIKKNKRIIEVSDYLQNEKKIIGLNYEKIKLSLYNSNNSSISYNIKTIMRKYYQKNITKYVQIFYSFTSIINIHKNNNEKYKFIEKITIFFQKDNSGTLFGDRIISSILSFFPCAKIISFKNVYFENKKIKLLTADEVYELFHNKNNKNDNNNKNDKNDDFEFVLFGEKNIDLSLFKEKESCLKEIRFNNCHFDGCLIGKDITQEIEKKITSYLGKNAIRIIYVE